MGDRVLGIAMNGVTGRMGYRQHLTRSVLAIRKDGGVELPDGSRIIPEPVLVGRSAQKLRAIAERHGIERWSTDLDTVLSDDSISVYFDAQITHAREAAVRSAINAGKHVYVEKPIADNFSAAIELAKLARDAGVKNGVVQDKLFLPGLLKLRRLIDSGFFGRILSIRGEFGYWVFEGDWQPAQRPSWNYRAEDGGGIVLDMFPHWHYILEQLFAPVRTVTTRIATHIPERWDENGQRYQATADDAAYAVFELEGGIVAQINSSWSVRVNRDELVEFQVDGTHGSAVAGLRHCKVQHRSVTPKAVWDPDAVDPGGYRDQWEVVPDNGDFPNGFRAQWELFLTHLYTDVPFPHDLLSGVRGLQLAEAGLQSAKTGRTVELEEVSLP
ncbi:Gfo/Idh/MocA family oxidoreductase [Thermobifida fusca]|jgi:predicted dehydrogenase|uniref:Oxidoreductase n=2 Tax=Thermobifida fusca TaxID=2021 RepID=A0A9P2TAN3_THEFU|nr:MULTISPECIES: Gfo/Idh/MocA family oxidoreductase [Thermobifida]AAZ55756.1 putative oxidoreductase [Thermobifida fusca YX]EOR71258.1 oxidoreductase [Thermobifida fusca TM51]MBO2529122.1 gfo/Idh/MocA family oxidoreductase [Thermobifida sp.]MDD6792347.1 Gfo/Idh/MocA family oxidoreductase [Thermobifida fusca]PPS94663.1 oxidoreductase [Thermobifida fusca]